MMQGWLGFPYIYVLTLGILQSIPNDLYEAAYIDGANAWQKFRNITFPMILAVAAPQRQIRVGEPLPCIRRTSAE